MFSGVRSLAKFNTMAANGGKRFEGVIACFNSICAAIAKARRTVTCGIRTTRASRVWGYRMWKHEVSP